jgi:hypothetical protein
MPLPNRLGRRTILGLLYETVGSGGVDACFDNGDGDIGVPMGEGDLEWSPLIVDGESDGGARDPRLERDLTLSKSMFRNGSGS